MTISITLKQYLEDHNVPYDTLEHNFSANSTEAAERAHVSGKRVAKAVIIKCGSAFKMVLLPATRHVSFELLQSIARGAELATEGELMTLFKDCDVGAIPALGMAYGLAVIVDDSLVDDGDVFFEGGDHKTLVRMNAEAFETMVHGTPHGKFSRDANTMKEKGFYHVAHS